MRRLLLIIGLSTLVLMQPTKMFAEEFTERCTSQINTRLGSEQRLYRRVLFGFSRAKEAPIGNVRYDFQGDPWIKMSNNLWRSTESTEKVTDSGMDEKVERDFMGISDAQTFRTGIFATRASLTSDLIPSILQSYRALQCRAASVCETARLALSGQTTAKPVTSSSPLSMEMIDIPGCRTVPMPTLNACAPSKTNDGQKSVSDTANILSYCQPVADQMMQREASLLKLSVSYDAAYRTLLQFSGTFDNFLTVFRIDLLQPIRESQQLLSLLSRIPCFISQCNE